MASPKAWQGRTSSTEPVIITVVCQSFTDLCAAAHMLSVRCEIHSILVFGQRMWTSETQGGLIQHNCKSFYQGTEDK